MSSRTRLGCALVLLLLTACATAQTPYRPLETVVLSGMSQAEVIGALEKEGYEYLRLAVSEQFTYQEADANGGPRERTTGLCTYLLFTRSRTKSWVNTQESVAVRLDPSGRADDILRHVSMTGP